MQLLTECGNGLLYNDDVIGGVRICIILSSARLIGALPTFARARVAKKVMEEKLDPEYLDHKTLL